MSAQHWAGCLAALRRAVPRHERATWVLTKQTSLLNAAQPRRRCCQYKLHHSWLATSSRYVHGRARARRGWRGPRVALRRPKGPSCTRLPLDRACNNQVCDEMALRPALALSLGAAAAAAPASPVGGDLAWPPRDSAGVTRYSAPGLLGGAPASRSRRAA